MLQALTTIALESSLYMHRSCWTRRHLVRLHAFADFDPRLITDRIWTEKSHIERVLADTVLTWKM